MSRPALKEVESNTMAQRLSRPAHVWGFVLVAVAVLVTPLLSLPQYYLHLLVMAFVAATAVLGLTVLMGMTGMLSLGAAGLWGVGAYTSALLATRLSVPVPLSMLAGTLAGTLLAAVLAPPVLRLRGHYFALATLGYNVLIYQVINSWVDVTRGPFGLSRIPRLKLGWLLDGSYAGQYLLVAAAVFLAGTALLLWLAHRPLGDAWMALREDEPVARSLGIDPFAYRYAAFVISGFYFALGGALYVHYVGVVTPAEIDFGQNVNFLLIAVIGGRASPWGALVGALLITALPEGLRFLADYRELIYGIILLLTMALAPEGLAQIFTRRGRRRAETTGAVS